MEHGLPPPGAAGVRIYGRTLLQVTAKTLLLEWLHEYDVIEVLDELWASD
jgi:hypothetical protein